MSVLVIDNDTIERIKEVVAWAEKHPQSMDDMLDVSLKDRLPIGDDENHIVMIPMNFRAVFSIDEYPQGNVRHLSVSCTKNYPAPLAVEEIMKHFGFVNTLKDCKVYLEEEVRAINVCEKI